MLTISCQEPLEDIENKCYEFIRCSETCVGDDTDASIPSSPTKTFPELQPVVLPNEIVLHILQYLNEPYKLRGRLIYAFEGFIPPIVIGFNKPRLWASISTLQICSATRSQAIKRYGQPLQWHLPFDASVDSLSLRTGVKQLETMTDLCFHHLPCHPSRSADINRTIAKTLYSNLRLRGILAGPEKPVRQTSYGLIDKIQSVEITVRQECNDGWGPIVQLLLECKALHTLKLKLYRHDTCGESLDEGQLNYVREGHHCYSYQDVMALDVLPQILNNSESLTILEMEKTKAQCVARINREDKRVSGTE
ncbi:hypothetical protein F4782DRAFT_545157 [Xylaria castorea]|nr:hypothetical protein F4782DRAFT_545157 [Xylaria castorea]